MRFQRLHIPAFGPFTNLELKFPSVENDFHVIYGENEAGKSSLLRAIRDLLFGIHGRSSDNFLHDYKSLRLMGEIGNRSGDQLIFQRRKGNQNTLLDQNGNTLPDTALLPYLGGVDLGYFSAMFGLGSAELREGATQLLQGEGEIGQALFSASMGGTPIHQVMDAMEEEAARLFKGRASSNVSIRPAANRYKELLKNSREAMVNAETWEALEKELAEQDAAKRRLEDELLKVDMDLGWISRCEDALPTVGRLNEERRLLEELPKLPDVASDFVDRAVSARKAVSDASGQVQVLVTQVAQLEGQLTECITSPEVIAKADALDGLHQDLGSFRTRKDRLTTLHSKLAGIEPVLMAGMKNLELEGELESLEALRLSSAVRRSCEEAAKDLQEGLRKRDENAKEAEAARQEIESQEEELKSLPELELTPLREALAVAATATEASKTLSTSHADVENLKRKVAEQHALVVGAPEDFDAASRLSVPQPGTIRRFRERFDDTRRDREIIEKRIHELEGSVQNSRDELGRLERRGELPTEDSLVEARGHRDHGWQLVLADWKGSGAKEELDPGVPLVDAFPKAIAAADTIADQLRRDAEAVAQAEEIRSQIQRSQAQISEESERLTSLESARIESQSEWEAEWAACGMKPRSPAEMEEWRESWIRFRDTLSGLRDAEAAAKSKASQVQQAQEALAAVMEDSPGKEFALLFEAARSRVQQAEESGGRRKEVAKQLQRHRNLLNASDLKTTELVKAVETAQEHWQSLCREVGIPDNTSPDTGLALLQERKELLADFDRWKEVSGECKETAVAVQIYEKAVSAEAQLLEIEADTAEGRETRLWQALSLARKAQAEHDQLAAQIQIQKNELATAKQAESQSLEALGELMRLAKLEAAEELEPLLANLEKRGTVQSQIEGFRLTLGELARGQSVDEFVASVQAEAEDADEFPARRHRQQIEKSEKQQELQAVLEKLVGLRSQKEVLENAGDTAADYRQQAESVAAALEQDASRYMRLRLAVHFLRAQIERFRAQNQGPLLEKSGEIFKSITRGAFDGLAAEFDDKDVPVMVGRRSDGTNVPVEGMSDGSRDQLYLALRLAALDRYLEEHEPMPLILDDLLITFDDERTKAILPQLATLAKRTQIFLFTHHEHLVEICRQTLGADQFHLHRLNTPALASAGPQN